MITTDQNALFGILGYQFHRKFSLYAGLNGTPRHALDVRARIRTGSATIA